MTKETCFLGILVGLAITASGRAAEPAGRERIDNVRAVMEEWVETRQVISKERQEWTLGREMLDERIKLVQREIASLRERIDQAQKNIATAGLQNVEVRKGLIESLPVESNSVDWVISNCVINLSPEKNKVFAEISRVLKPGGRMRVSDLVVSELPEWARRDQALYCSCIAGAIGEEAYLDGLRQAGLNEVRVVERQVYNAGQIAALIGSEVEGPQGRAAEMAESLAGKVWSALVTGRK